MKQAMTENNTDNWKSANRINHVSKSHRVLVIAPMSNRTVAGKRKSCIDPAITICCLKVIMKQLIKIILFL